MSTNLPTVSVIIPAREAAIDLARALQSVRDQTYPNIVDVVVAAADDATAKAAAGVTVVPNPEGRTPTGLNRAIAAARGEVIVRCDARVVLPSGYVARAVDTLARTGAANVGGMQVPVGGSPWQRAIAAAMKSRLGAGDARYRVGGEEGPVETVYLGAFRRDALEGVGGFDETFHRNQDYELNHRLIEAGEKVWFDPELQVVYTPRSSLDELARQYFDYGRAKREFNRKHPGHLRWRQLAAPALTVVLALSIAVSPLVPLALVAPGLYALALTGAGLAGEGSWWRTATTLATMHLSWGVGFLSGRAFVG